MATKLGTSGEAVGTRETKIYILRMTQAEQEAMQRKQKRRERFHAFLSKRFKEREQLKVGKEYKIVFLPLLWVMKL